MLILIVWNSWEPDWTQRLSESLLKMSACWRMILPDFLGNVLRRFTYAVMGKMYYFVGNYKIRVVCDRQISSKWLRTTLRVGVTCFTMDSMCGNGEVSDLPKNKSVQHPHFSWQCSSEPGDVCVCGVLFRWDRPVLFAHVHNNLVCPSNSIQINEVVLVRGLWITEHLASSGTPLLLAALPCMRTFKYLSWFFPTFKCPGYSKYAEKTCLKLPFWDQPGQQMRPCFWSVWGGQ